MPGPQVQSRIATERVYAYTSWTLHLLKTGRPPSSLPPLPATFSAEERPTGTQRDPACRGDDVSPTTTADFAHDPYGPLQNRPSPTTLPFRHQLCHPGFQNWFVLARCVLASWEQAELLNLPLKVLWACR